MPRRADCAATKVCQITELLELILINVDQRTLLLSQRVASKWRDVVQRNHDIQKKLFFIQPTFEEALQLGLVSPSSMVFSPWPQEVILVNSLVIRMGEYTHDGYRSWPHGEISNAIALEREKGEHGSWERMYARTKTMPQDTRLVYGSSVEILVDKVLDRRTDYLRDRKTDPRRYRGPREGDVVSTRCKYVWSDRPMRSLMKTVEKHVSETFGVRFDWASARLALNGYAMTYRIYEKLGWLALEQGVKKWQDLRIWNRDGQGVPRERAINEALFGGIPDAQRRRPRAQRPPPMDTGPPGRGSNSFHLPSAQHVGSQLLHAAQLAAAAYGLYKRRQAQGAGQAVGA